MRGSGGGGGHFPYAIIIGTLHDGVSSLLTGVEMWLVGR